MKRIIQNITKAISPHIALLLPVLLCGNVIAQSNANFTPRLASVLKPESTERWLSFRDDNTLNPASFFNEYKTDMGLQNDDVMQLNKIKTDELGYQHYNYDQYYKNLRVIFGEFKLHQNANGILQSANGRLIKGINATNIASITEQVAFQTALKYVNAKKYLWQNESLEAELKRIENNPKATYLPVGELVFAPSTFDAKYQAKDYRLSWSFKIYTDDLDAPAKTVYVDALTGVVNYHTPLSMICSAGTGTSAFNGSVSVSTYYTGSTYRSHNDCQATDIRVYNCAGGGAVTNYHTDGDNTWTNQSATQAQWGAAQTYSYYLGEHSRQSWDGAAGDMIAYNNANAGQNNACWGCTGNSTIYYAGNTSAATDDWNTNDIMGHEFTHGVVQDEAGLVYQDESGALNESFADIFGEMVESWSEGINDWLVGGDRGAIRSFTNPNAYNDPDTYNGTNWYVGTGDNGGVHTNSGVQNHWFYLLSNGGSGTNDNGTAYNVSGITRFVARDIAYRGLVFYLSGSDGYIDARAASLQAAYDLYGGCSNEIIQVGNAWRAVGVESQSAQYNNSACGNYPATGQYAQAIHQLSVANGCAVNITASATTVYFSAKDRVVIYPGFNATSGSKFYAYIEPCAITMYKANQEIGMSDAEKGFISKDLQKESASNANQISNSVNASPNPFDNKITLSINLQNNATVKVKLFNAVGQVVRELENYPSLSQGQYGFTYNTSELLPGFYFIHVEIDGKAEVIKVIKM